MGFLVECVSTSVPPTHQLTGVESVVTSHNTHCTTRFNRGRHKTNRGQTPYVACLNHTPHSTSVESSTHPSIYITESDSI